MDLNPRYFKRLPANWIESKSQRIVFEFIHKATNPISRLVFPRRRTMISFLEKRENVACPSKSIDCARGTTSFALVKHRGGGRAQDVAWRMLPSLRKFPIRHRSSRFSSFPEEDALEAVYFIYIINSHNDLHRAYFCKFPSNRDPIALNAMDSVIQFQRLKITQQLFPSMGRNASCCTQIDSRDCNRSQF